MKRYLLGLSVLVATSSACSGPAPMQPTEVAVPHAGETAQKAAIGHPLALAMPADVIAFATMPGTRGLSDVVARVVEGADLLDLVAAEVEQATSVSRSAISALLRDLDGVAIGVTRERQPLVVMHTDDDAAVERLLSDDAGFRAMGDGPQGARRYAIVTERPQLAELELHWHRPEQLLLVGRSELLDAGARALGGRRSLARDPSFIQAAQHFAADPAVNVFVDLGALAPIPPSSPVTIASPLVASLTLSDSLEVRVEIAIAGPALPPTALHADPPPLDLAGALPGDTIGFLAYSSRIAGPPERASAALIDALASLDRSAARDLLVAAKAFGIDPTALVAALGDQGAVGFVLPPAGKVKSADVLWEGGLVVAQQKIRDRRAVASIIEGLQKALTTSSRVVVEPSNDGFFARSVDEDMGAAFAIRGDELVVTFGHGEGAKAMLDGSGPTLADDETYRRLRSRFAGEHVALWMDLERSLDALSRNVPDDADELLSLARTTGERPIGGLSFGWNPEGEGWRVHASMHDVSTLGIASSLMIYSVRRYLAASKTAEAKATVGAIARGARAAYEREQVGPKRHRLCASAQPVPSRVPSGQKYLPSGLPGEDFRNGDDEHGWPCLRFELTQPHYYRYTYQRGGGYLGPARGGPDPGPHGFEVAAEGDLDGDGDTSLFTVVGQVDPQTGELVVSPQMFVDAELE